MLNENGEMETNIVKHIKINKVMSIFIACIMVLTIFSGCDSLFNGVVEPLVSGIQGAEGYQPADSIPSADIRLSNPREEIDLKQIPVFNGEKPFVEMNNNVPYFEMDENTRSSYSYEYYSDLDALGRCGVCYACIGKDLMPTEERGPIGMVKPSGWHTVKYDCVDGKYLYNRCHLIGYQLAGENANEKNLITGTRYLNVVGMLLMENEVADYVRETNNHVMYRVTPIFEGDNLVANGVLMEGYSVEDAGSGVCFNVYCYNAQPGVTIDYKTGESKLQK